MLTIENYNGEEKKYFEFDSDCRYDVCLLGYCEWRWFVIVTLLNHLLLENHITK